MAQYRCSVQKAISRGKGQSAIAKAAYNARDLIRDERTGEMKDFLRKNSEVMFSGIFIDPKRNAPAWAQDRPALWNAASAVEKRKDAREAQEIIVNLPHELTDQQRRFMLTDFVREQITRGTGRIADVNIHAAPTHGDDRNIHAHILMTVREIGPDGFGEKLPEVTEQQIRQWKEKWAERGAKELRKAGFEIEADRWAVGHLRLEQQRQAALERGDLAHAETLDREATKHLGPHVASMERKGIETERGNAYREIVERNGDRAELRAMKRELAELEKQIGIEHEAQREIKWQDAVGKAAIEKEKIERRFVEPTPERGTLAGGNGKEWPVTPPQPEPINTAPRHHFEDAAREATASTPPQAPPENLKRTAAEIWVAYNRSHTAQDFAAALEEKGMQFATVTKDEADRSRTEAAAAKEQGRFAPTYREGEIIAVTEQGHVYQLNQRTTGDDRRQVDKFMAKLDRTPLQGMEVTKQAMHARAEQRIIEVQAFRDLLRDTRTAERFKQAQQPGRAANDNIRPLAAARTATDVIVRTTKAPARTLGKVAGALGTAGKLVEGLVNFFDPGPPKTRAQIETAIQESDRAEHAAAKDAAVAQHRAVSDDGHDRAIQKQQEEARRQEQAREDYKRYHRDDRDR